MIDSRHPTLKKLCVRECYELARRGRVAPLPEKDSESAIQTFRVTAVGKSKAEQPPNNNENNGAAMYVSPELRQAPNLFGMADVLVEKELVICGYLRILPTLSGDTMTPPKCP